MHPDGCQTHTDRPKIYAYDPTTGDHTDITTPVSTDGLDMNPTITPETIVTVRDRDGSVLGHYPIKDLPWSVDQVQEIIDRGGHLQP